MLFTFIYCILYTTCGSIILLYSPRPIQCLNSVARNVTPEDFRLQDTKKPSSIIVPSNSSVMQGRDLHNPTFLRHAMLRLAPCPPRVHVCRLVAVNPHTSTLYNGKSLGLGYPEPWHPVNSIKVQEDESPLAAHAVS